MRGIYFLTPLVPVCSELYINIAAIIVAADWLTNAVTVLMLMLSRL